MPRKPETRYLYNAWYQMIQRCENESHPFFADYGARGITVCSPWRSSFAVFMRDVGARPSPGHTLDRINNEKGYMPSNVAWATRKAQANNRRSNRRITYRGRAQTAAQWAEELFPENPHRVQTRLAKGWSVERALSEAIREKKASMLEDYLVWNGERRTVREWGELLFPGKPKTLPMRLAAGWSLERAFTEKKRGW
jgi:hypothetical protein